jgi:hypothetical protein
LLRPAGKQRSMRRCTTAVVGRGFTTARNGSSAPECFAAPLASIAVCPRGGAMHTQITSVGKVTRCIVAGLTKRQWARLLASASSSFASDAHGFPPEALRHILNAAGVQLQPAAFDAIVRAVLASSRAPAAEPQRHLVAVSPSPTSSAVVGSPGTPCTPRTPRDTQAI